MSDGFPTQDEATITIPRAEYERLRDAERIAWVMASGWTKDISFERDGRGWWVFIRPSPASPIELFTACGSYENGRWPDLDCYPEARAIIDAAMEAST